MWRHSRKDCGSWDGSKARHCSIGRERLRACLGINSTDQGSTDRIEKSIHSPKIFPRAARKPKPSSLGPIEEENADNSGASRQRTIYFS
jgi:hypothetical protein